jgi:hypothetical protein
MNPRLFYSRWAMAAAPLILVSSAVAQPPQPAPCEFISSSLPKCAVIRPTSPGQIDAVGAINGFIADGLFIGQSPEFLQLLVALAEEADAAERRIR